MRRFTFVFVLVSAALLLLSAFKHPVYLSVTDLKYSEEAKNLRGSVKIFVNDLETTLKRVHQKPVDLINIKDSAAILSISTEYLRKNLIISVNDKPSRFTVLGFEQNEEAFWIYIETAKCPRPAKVHILNTILYQDFPQQMNIIHVEVNKNSQSFRLINPESLAEFIF
jgi:hypothetical protein